MTQLTEYLSDYMIFLQINPILPYCHVLAVRLKKADI